MSKKLRDFCCACPLGSGDNSVTLTEMFTDSLEFNMLKKKRRIQHVAWQRKKVNMPLQQCLLNTHRSTWGRVGESVLTYDMLVIS